MEHTFFIRVESRVKREQSAEFRERMCIQGI